MIVGSIILTGKLAYTGNYLLACEYVKNRIMCQDDYKYYILYMPEEKEG